MRKLIFIALILSLNIFSVQNSKSAEESQMNIGAYVDAELSGIGGGGTFIPDDTPPVIYDVMVYEVTTNSSKISWKTNENSSAYLYYGKTMSYEAGIIQAHKESITFFHEITVDGLTEGTKYYFQLRSLDSAGNQAIKDGYEFTTLSDLEGPPNIISFSAQSFDGKIILNWKNPDGDDFVGVQINRNINSPALNFDQGEIIYRGNLESFEDKNIENGIKYYYTVFSYDSAGNFSSGAIASAIGIKTVTPPVEPPIIPDSPVIPPEIIPFDVENLETVPDLENKEIEIRWDNPDDNNFEEVEIRKSENFPAMTPEEGEVIYKGGENSFTDGNIESDIIYYYTVFTKDKSGNYSAGVVVTGTLEKLPPSSMDAINIKDVNFIFSKEALLLPQREDGKIYTFPNKEINIYYDSKNLPETLKTIIVTVGRSSYILNSDSDNKFYRTKFISPDNAGNYPITISVLDFKNGKIFQTKAELAVEGYGKIYELKIKDYESKNFFEKKISSIKYQASNIFCGKDTKCPIGHLVSALALDLEKAGVEGAKITLYEFDESNGEWQLWNSEKYNQENPQLTNKEGEFGFIVPNGKYKIVIEKENYVSKSEIIEVGNNIINGKTEIKGKNNWLIFIIIIVILFLVLIIGRRAKRNKNKIRHFRH